MTRSQLAGCVAESKALIERELEGRLPPAVEEPRDVHEAMRYATLHGGKRLRPILTICVSNMAGRPPEEVIGAACAIECVHAASLVLDDLPSMDNAPERRGRPSTHVAFGEATAILAATSLIALGFDLVVSGPGTLGKEAAVQDLARSIGSRGLVGGQSADLEHPLRPSAPGALEMVHDLKAGTLFAAAVRIPALLLGLEPQRTDCLVRFAHHLGVAFQISDDLLDIESSAESESGVNLAARIGTVQAHQRLDELIGEANCALDEMGPGVDEPRSVAEFVRTRAK